MDGNMLQIICSAIFSYIAGLLSINKDYWKKRNVPYVEPLPLFGSSFDMLETPLCQLDLQRYQKFGPIFGYFEGITPRISIGDPNLLGDILGWKSTNFPNRRELQTGDSVIDNMVALKRDKDWKRIRNIMTNAFTPKRIREITENVFQDCVDTLINNFRQAAENEKIIDLKRAYGSLTTDVITTTAFSIRSEKYNNPDNIITGFADSILNQKLKFKLIFYHLLPSWLMRILRIDISSRPATEKLRRVILEIIQERKLTGVRRNDILQLLLDIPKEGSPGATNEKYLTDDELVSQCAVLSLAGYETTSSALSFATYFLAINQEIQDKLRTEVDAVMDENNDRLTYDVVKNMPYLDMVLKETLRLYPPAFRLDRQAEDDFKLKDTDIIIQKGMVVTIPVFAIHRDPKFWPNPEMFDPERFAPGPSEDRHKFCYLPFGEGPRKCIGNPFATMEIKFCLSYVIRNFKIKACPETKVPLEFDLSQHSLLQPKEVKVALEPRHL